MKATFPANIVDFDPFNTNTVAETHNLGDIMYADNRSFRYTLAGTGGLTAGQLALAPAPKANHQGQTATATAIGSTTVSITVGATAVVAGEYSEGYFAITSGTGAGAMYKISNAPAISSSGTGVITLFDPIANNALTSGNTYSLVHNAFANAVAGTSQTRRPAGVTMVSPAAGAYYWSQTHGVACATADGVIAVGTMVVPSSGTAGDITAQSTTFATAQAQAIVGQALIQAGASATSNPVFLSID